MSAPPLPAARLPDQAKRSLARRRGLYARDGVSATPTVPFRDCSRRLRRWRFSASLAVDDLNGDGNLDLVRANALTDDVSVLLGNGDGTFQAAASYFAGEFASSVAIGDLTGDGNLDLAVTTGLASVLLGNGDGSFQSPVNYFAGQVAFSVAVADLNGDGELDLAVADLFSDDVSFDDVSVLTGKGDGTFETAVGFSAHTRTVLDSGGRPERGWQARPGRRQSGQERRLRSGTRPPATCSSISTSGRQ
jgi:FG-GAP-like repeat